MYNPKQLMNIHLGYEKPVSTRDNEILDANEIWNMNDFILKNIKKESKDIFSLR